MRPNVIERARWTLAALVSAAALASCGESPARAEAPREVGSTAGASEPDAAHLRAELDEARAEVERLRCDLARETQARLEREEEWLRYTTALSALDLDSLPRELDLSPDGHEPDPASTPAAPTAEELALRQRNEEIARSLRTLLVVEEVRGLDLLEAGSLEHGATGPVVFRVLDAAGRLAGSLCAERLRLEGSRAARTLTLVLEDGYETRGGVRTDFAVDVGTASEGPAHNVRRIVLPRVDPMSWIDTLPELFGGKPLDEAIDDGRWNLALVRGSLNQLLRQDAALGCYRLRELGGVTGGVLRDVQLEVLDKDGKLERTLLADRMTIEREARGLMLLLEDGAQVRGEEKTAFLDGRFRIFLPRAKADEWEAARLPGLVASQEPPRDAAPGSGD